MKRNRRSVTMLPWLRREYVTHEEGSSLSNDAALALVIIFQTQEIEGGNLEQETKTMLKPEESPQWTKKSILVRREAANWLAKKPVRHSDFEGKSL